MSNSNEGDSCQICKSKDVNPLLKWNRFSISECRQCKVVFATPLPSDQELNDFYQGFLFNKPRENEIAKTLANRKDELIRLFAWTNDLKGKSFVDVGGGTGMAYKAAKDLGLIAYYQDLDEQAKTFTKEQFGLTDEFILTELEGTDVKYDCVFSDNVIEHVKDPIAFTNLLFTLVAPGGTMVMKTPNARNTEMYFNPIISIKGYVLRAIKDNNLPKALFLYFKRFWHCDPPRHLYSFTAKSFDHLVGNMEETELTHEVSYYRTPWFSNTVTKWIFRGDSGSNSIKSILIRCLVLPIIPVEVILQTLKWLLLTLGILSPGGLVLTLRRTKR